MGELDWNLNKIVKDVIIYKDVYILKDVSSLKKLGIEGDSLYKYKFVFSS